MLCFFYKSETPLLLPPSWHFWAWTCLDEGFGFHVTPYTWSQVADRSILLYAGTLVCSSKLNNVSLSAVPGWPESNLKPPWGSPLVWSETEADVWPSEPAGLSLCVRWCPSAPSQGPARSSLVLHKREKSKQIIHQGHGSLWHMPVNVLQIAQWKCDVCTSVLIYF